MDDYSTILSSIGVVVLEVEEWEKFKAEPWQPDESHGLLVATLTESAADAAILALAREVVKWHMAACRLAEALIATMNYRERHPERTPNVEALLARYAEEASDEC